MSIAIKVENLSKIYQIGEIGTGTLSRDMERWWVTKVMGKEDPFLKIGQTNDRSKKGENDIVYSLQDINFEIEQGDAVGIIGKNGAGKSTLLKILSRITSPTTGKIQVKGRVASLLEVGTGFHPELSGRENIYLNGAILGMRKKEITRKLDEIIGFSGVERYIDTPVKRYSSGMYVRLAFAVAAHLESEILIVDEVLAVGDAEFQKKCLGKMGDISKGEGRTVLFVSHNMAAVSSLCNQGVLLKDGYIDCAGNIENVLERYMVLTKKGSDFVIKDANFDLFIEHQKVIDIEDDVRFELNIYSKIDINEGVFIDFAILNHLEEFVIHYRMNANLEVTKIMKGNNKYDILIKKPRIKSGEYSFVIYIYDINKKVYLWVNNFSKLQISSTNKPLEFISNYKSHFIPEVILTSNN
jgi:lipopolysaccharide transport system ATP-binding protein